MFVSVEIGTNKRNRRVSFATIGSEIANFTWVSWYTEPEGTGKEGYREIGFPTRGLLQF
jgi:hypothetical protein